jgi:hypothetical protein
MYLYRERAGRMVSRNCRLANFLDVRQLKRDEVLGWGGGAQRLVSYESTARNIVVEPKP